MKRPREKEKKGRDQQRKKKLNWKQQSRERLEKVIKLQQNHELFRLTTEYIEENTSTWEAEWKQREQERSEKFENWERMRRLEKVKEIRRLWNDKMENNTKFDGVKQPTIEHTTKWKIWRKSEHKDEKLIKEPIQEQHQKLSPLFNKLEIKIRKPMLETKKPPAKYRYQWPPPPTHTGLKNWKI